MNGKRWARPALMALCAGGVCALTLPAQAQLVAGVDDTLAGNGVAEAMVYDFNTATWTPLWDTGDQAWGMAANDAGRKLYVADGATLKVWDYSLLGTGAAPTEVGTFIDSVGGGNLPMLGLAYDPVLGKLYGSSGSGGEGVFEIDTATGVSTMVFDYDNTMDVQGLDYNPVDGLLYAFNDVSGTARGLYAIDLVAQTITAVDVPYTSFLGSANDVDGLAVSPTGIAYYIIDEDGEFGRFDISTLTTLPPMMNPYPAGASEIFAAGAWAGTLLAAPQDGDLQVTMTDSPDPAGVGGTITYTVNVLNSSNVDATNVQVVTTLDGTTNYVSSSMGLHDGAASGGVHTAVIGTMTPLQLLSYTIQVSAPMVGNPMVTAVGTQTETDPDPSNNTATADTTVAVLADVVVTVDDSPDPVILANETLIYTITVANNGPNDATGVLLTFALDSQTAFASTSAGMHDGSPFGGTVTAMLGTIPASSSDIVTVSVTAGSTQATLSATASAVLAETDPTPGDASETELTAVEIAPANDECANAVALLLNNFEGGTTFSATQSTTATCGADERDVWYAFAPLPNTAYRFTATFFDTAGSIAAFAGCGGPEIRCATATTTTPGRVDVVSDSLGSAILLRVATDTLDESLFDIVAELDPTPPPSNDDCGTATVVTSLPFNEVVVVDDASPEPDRVTCNSGTTVMNQTAWWRFDGTGQRIAVTMNDEDFDGGSFDGAFAAFEGTDCTNMVQIGCSDPAPVTFTIDTVPGMSYFFVGMTWSSAPQTDTGNEVHIDIVEIIRTGGCCVGGSCSIVSEADCNGMGGVYRGDDTACLDVIDTEPGTFMDISATGTALSLADDGEVTVATTLLGNVRIANNGGVAIGAAAGDLGTANTALPATGTFVTNATEVYFPFWDDLDSDIGNVYWQELGDRVIVQWHNRPHFSGSTSLVDGVTFQIQLFAPGSDIKAQYLYQDVSFDPNQSATGGCNGGLCDGGASATIGYQEPTQAVTYSFDSAVLQDGTVLSVLANPCAAPACVCEADGNAAQVNVFDLLAYLDDWFAQSAAADIDGTPGVNVFDLLFFLDCWFPASAGNPC